MAIKFSTGLKNSVLDTESLKDSLDDGYIKVYSGTVPADADAALGAAVLLNTYSDAGASPGAGNGLDMAAAAASGALLKESTQTWKGTAVATGVATFWRYVQLADTGAASSSEKRIQGTIGGAGADLFVQSTTFTSAEEYTLDYFSVAVPNL